MASMAPAVRYTRELCRSPRTRRRWTSEARTRLAGRSLLPNGLHVGRVHLDDVGSAADDLREFLPEPLALESARRPRDADRPLDVAVGVLDGRGDAAQSLQYLLVVVRDLLLSDVPEFR